MESYNVAEAKAHLSDILDRVSDGEEILLTRRGKPVARVVPVGSSSSILGAGVNDPNINPDALVEDTWWKATPDDETRDWYE